MAHETVADRLTFISELRLEGGAPLLLQRPILVEPGQRYWIDDQDRALIVEDLAGRRRSYPLAYGTGPDAPR